MTPRAWACLLGAACLLVTGLLLLHHTPQLLLLHPPSPPPHPPCSSSPPPPVPPSWSGEPALARLASCEGVPAPTALTPLLHWDVLTSVLRVLNAARVL